MNVNNATSNSYPLEIVVLVRHVWGKDNIYPVNETAKGFCRLIGQKTFTKENLTVIKGLGYNITVENPQLPIF